MDLEEITRNLFRVGRSKNEIKEELQNLTGSEAKAEAILKEVEHTENLPEGFIKSLCNYPKTTFSADESGLGCRGEGDFIIHHSLAEVIGPTGAVVDSLQQDDGGIIRTDHGFISAAVDGMHSRLSHFPFLAGFHAARAAVRDVLVMGSRPVAMLADIHLANDGDIGKILDYTAGASAVCELLDVPLIGGSTLRIGGDLVTGDRLTGCMISIGTGQVLTARRNARIGDVLVMTEGCGGGTITTTALYNGYPESLLETLNVKSIQAVKKMLETPIAKKIHAMTDITNGGIRGDASEFGSAADARININASAVFEMISPKVLNMLNELDIDPLGISTDALVFTVDPADSDELLEFLSGQGVRAMRIGDIVQGSGVFIKTNDKKHQGERLQTRFREAPYTPLKMVVDRDTSDVTRLDQELKDALDSARDKKVQVIEWILAEHKD